MKKRMTLSQKGKYDEINGRGRVPDKRDFPLPKWMKPKKKFKQKKVEKYYG